LLEVVNVPGGFVNVRLEVLDVGSLSPDLSARVRDEAIHLVLFGAQVVNDAAQILIVFIEFPKFLIHLKRLSLKLPDVFIKRRDVFLKFLDFVVKYEFELIQLLGFLLETEDFLFFISNLQVLLMD